MVERGENLISHSAEFTWRHPQNGCPMFYAQPFITEEIVAKGPTLEDAIRYAKILAENSPKICDICEQNYQLVS